MRALRPFAAAAVVASLALAAPEAANAETNLLFILDGSNSVWGQVDGQTKTDGKYFGAANAREIKVAVTRVAQVEEKAPEPGKEPREVFRDDFDGDDLGEHWEVISPNPDSFIVEDGSLLIIGDKRGSLREGDTVENIFRLTKPLPKGDWTATIKFRMGYMTGREMAFLALYEDKDNYVGAIFFSQSYYEGLRGAKVYFGGRKRLKARERSFQKAIWGGSDGVAFTADSPPNPFLLRLKKVGRSYIPAVKVLGVKGKDGSEPEWKEHEKFTVLRPKGNLAIGFYQYEKVSGESTVNIDWIKIEVPE